MTYFKAWMGTFSLHNLICIKYAKADRPQFLLFPQVLTQGQETYYWPPAVAKEWLSWHTGVNSDFMRSCPFLWHLWSMPDGYLHHSLQRNHCKQEKTPQKKQPTFACSMVFSSKYQKSLGACPFYLCSSALPHYLKIGHSYENFPNLIGCKAMKQVPLMYMENCFGVLRPKK